MQGVQHPWRDPTKYELIHESRAYAPKAVVGLAYWRAVGHFPDLNRLSGGEGHANDVLRRLGFEIREIDRTGQDWTADECSLIVADYFDMEAAELTGQPYNKSEHSQRLRQVIGRTRGSVERKHMNISAVMVELALPYVNGYKPNVSRQELLASAPAAAQCGYAAAQGVRP